MAVTIDNVSLCHLHLTHRLWGYTTIFRHSHWSTQLVCGGSGWPPRRRRRNRDKGCARRGSAYKSPLPARTPAESVPYIPMRGEAERGVQAAHDPPGRGSVYRGPTRHNRQVPCLGGPGREDSSPISDLRVLPQLANSGLNTLPSCHNTSSTSSRSGNCSRPSSHSPVPAPAPSPVSIASVNEYPSTRQTWGAHLAPPVASGSAPVPYPWAVPHMISIAAPPISVTIVQAAAGGLSASGAPSSSAATSRRPSRSSFRLTSLNAGASRPSA